MSEVVDATDAAEPRKPLWKNPFVIFFVAGCVLVTLVAPLFRRVAPPPDVSGSLPAWSLSDQDGRIYGTAQIGARVALVALVTSEQPDSSRQAARALAQLEPELRRARADVALVLVDLDAREGAARSGWLAAVAPGAAGIRVVAGEGACGMADTLFAPEPEPRAGGACAGARRLAAEARLALIDADGQPRGTYGSAGQALYEAFERTLRTCDLGSTRE